MKPAFVIRQFIKLTNPEQVNERPTTKNQLISFLNKHQFKKISYSCQYTHCFIHQNKVQNGSLVVLIANGYTVTGVLHDKQTFDGGGIFTYKETIEYLEQFVK